PSETRKTVRRSLPALGSLEWVSQRAARQTGRASSTRAAASVSGGNWPVRSLFRTTELAKLAAVQSSSAHCAAVIGRLDMKRCCLGRRNRVPRDEVLQLAHVARHQRE